MAVVDKYVNADRESGGFGSPISSGAGKEFIINRSFTVAADDDDGSIYRLASIPSNAVVVGGLATLLHTNITGGTDYDIGLYDLTKSANSGAVVSVDLFRDGISMANTTAYDPFADVFNATNQGQPIWQLLGLTSDPNKQYDIAITANTVGTAAGTINVTFKWISQG